jgi:hypothetical protein
MNVIRLKRYTAKPLTQGQQHVWPMRITAEGLNGAPSAVFVYAKAKDGDPQGDVFQCMASVPQLEEVSTLGPVSVTDTLQTPFYRTAEALFTTRSAEEADEVWQSLLEDAQNLAINLDAKADLDLTETIEASADGLDAV